MKTITYQDLTSILVSVPQRKMGYRYGVMPLQGLCAGCCRAINFMQSSDMPESIIPDIAIGADTAGGTDA